MDTLSKKIKLISIFVVFVVIGIFIFPKLKINLHNGPQTATADTIEAIAPDTNAKYFYFNKDTSQKPQVSALAYIVGDLNTGEIILEKNQDEKLPIASTTKLMTALVANELPDNAGVATVSQKALNAQGENGNLYLGEKIAMKDLPYPLLLESSNDAGEVMAEYFGRDNFIQKMNQEAQKLMMTSTSYEDPTGLSKNNQSTASDMFKLSGYLAKDKPEILNITTQKMYSTKNHNWYSINQFLNDPGYIGGKSGYTDPALQTVVSIFSLPLAQDSSRPIGIVLLHSQDRHKDVENIVKYLKNNIYYGGVADANTAWVKQRADLADISEPDFVTLDFMGDIMLDRGVKNSVLKNFNGDYSALFNKLDIIKKSDIAFANLEGPASDQGTDTKNLYSFRMDPSVIPAISGAGINVLSVANNHIGDWGRDAFTDTLSRLRENEILYTGGGENSEEAEQPITMEKNGIKIGFLAFSDKGPDNMPATENYSGILLTSNPRFDEIIQNASKEVDDLIVYFHDGEEYATMHDARQAELAHKAVDDGAKIVIGSHPHVVQDYETYKNGYIAYSLGNFIYDQNISADTMQGALLQIKLNRNGNMSVIKNTVKLNSAFQPDQIILGKEEKINFSK